ncbi:type 1 fimbrial protein [Enterobacter kobei]|nr:type 1 fimbrial protein [Enterobacter kobei]
MENAEILSWLKVLRQSLLSNLACSTMLSGMVMLATPGVSAVSLDGVDGEHGLLTITGELVDSPCRLSMDSRDQTVDLGTLDSSELSYLGARSRPVTVTVRLEGCLPASGRLYDEQTGQSMLGNNQPVVNVAFIAPSDVNNPALMKLDGVEGIALRVRDDHKRDVHFGSRSVPQLLAPGDNTLHWTIMAERVPGPLRPGPFRAVTDFKMSYD